MPEDNLTTASHSSQAETHAFTNEVAKSVDIGHITGDVLLRIVDYATYITESEETFPPSAPIKVYGPRKWMLHPDHEAHLRQYSAVNRWWRAVICDIRPRDIDVECHQSQYFRDSLDGLIQGNIRFVRTLFWDYEGRVFSHRYPLRSNEDVKDTSTPDTRTELFGRFLQYVDWGMRDLILLGLQLGNSLDVTTYAGWRTVRHFQYGFEYLPNSIRVVTSLLRELHNLESLHLKQSFGESAMELPQRPTYSLKSYHLSGVEDRDFAEWTGGNSRGTLEELLWCSEDDTEEDEDNSVTPWFKEDLSDIFPGDSSLSLQRLTVGVRYLPLLKHCDVEALRWLEIAADGECSISNDIYHHLKNFKHLTRFWIQDSYVVVDMVVGQLKAGIWPALASIRLSLVNEDLDYVLEDYIDLRGLERACESRMIVLKVSPMVG